MTFIQNMFVSVIFFSIKTFVFGVSVSRSLALVLYYVCV